MISIRSRLPSAVTAMSSRAVAALLSLVTLCAACTNTPPSDPEARFAATAASSASIRTTPSLVDASAPVDVLDATDASDLFDASADAEADGGASPDARAPVDARPFVADNKVLPPLESDELTTRAKKLFDAIVHDDPALGESFWFPKEPFIPLKDVKGPDKYWNNLHATYARDIHALHRKRKSWEGATFVGFKMGSTPKWVPPGDEANKIGYYRSFRGKLTYRIDDKNSTIDVHTIISWQGEWFITHLSKFKKK